MCCLSVASAALGACTVSLKHTQWRVYPAENERSALWVNGSHAAKGQHKDAWQAANGQHKDAIVPWCCQPSPRWLASSGYDLESHGMWSLPFGEKRCCSRPISSPRCCDFGRVLQDSEAAASVSGEQWRQECDTTCA